MRKPVRTLFGWLLYRRVSMPLSLRLARTAVRPGQVTALGAALGLGAGALLATGRYGWMVVGAVSASMAKLLDAVDGELARAKHLDTSTGYVVDGLVDRMRDVAIVTGTGVGAWRGGSGSALLWTLAAAVGYLAFFYVSAAFPSHWREARSRREVDEKHAFRVSGGLRLGAGDTIAVLVLVSAVAGRPLWFVAAVAIAAPVAIAVKARRLFRARPWEEASRAAPEDR
jgi:phosphatidylglycerophosphate synthase